MNRIKYNSFLLLLILFVTSCDKAFLDKKQSSSIIQPSILDDFQRLLDNPIYTRVMPGLSHLSADDFHFMSKQHWESARTSIERNAYIWDKDVYGGAVKVDDWNIPYRGIFYANSVLAGINDIIKVESNRSKYNNIKGSAHFIRAYTYFELVKNFGTSYDQKSAHLDLGVPLRLRPEIDEILPRATLKDCYDQIFKDLAQAGELLTLKVPNPSRNRPSKLAVYALNARINLSMRRYEKAYIYADSALTLYDELIDYNTVNTTSITPFSTTNAETIYNSLCVGYYSSGYLTTDNSVSVDSNLTESYNKHDLRAQIYFSPLSGGKGYYMKRGYDGSGQYPFNGLANDELFLIKAECAARAGDYRSALESLNKLLITRFVKDKFIPIKANSAEEALDVILKERRKSLVYRGLRWDDLKRLNKEGANITLKRVLGFETYTLPPNDPRYVFNIPDDEISYSGIIQNMR